MGIDPMNFLKTGRLLALTMTLASATCAASNAGFHCAPESYLRVCSPAALWSTFEWAYVEDGEAEHPPGAALDPAVADQLRVALEEQISCSKFVALGKGLPAAVALAWQMITCEISPQEAAHSARFMEGGADQRALLQMLVHLDRDPALVAALNWTLDQQAARDITLMWLLLARNDQVTALVLRQMIQCYETYFNGCLRELPTEVVFTVEQLQSVWPHMSLEGRRSVLLRTEPQGLESFLRRELLVHPDDSQLQELAGFEAWGNFEVQTILARLLMEQLLNPTVSQDERFTCPASVRHYLDVELSAWRSLLLSHNTPAELWPALAASDNP